MKNKICSIILARGSSKGLKNKNILNFCGKPLILWTIEACFGSGIKDVYVSSDSDKILKLSRDYGAKIIKRPKKLSQDKSSSESCWLHAINYLKQQNLNYEIIVAPQVTSPLRKNNDIKRALVHFKQKKFDSLFSANSINDTLLWSKKNQSLRPINYDYSNRLRRQDMAENIIENGSFYIFKSKIFRSKSNRICGKFGFFLLKKWQQFEIDNLEDFNFCKHIMGKYILEKTNV